MGLSPRRIDWRWTASRKVTLTQTLRTDKGCRLKEPKFVSNAASNPIQTDLSNFIVSYLKVECELHEVSLENESTIFMTICEVVTRFWWQKNVGWDTLSSLAVTVFWISAICTSTNFTYNSLIILQRWFSFNFTPKTIKWLLLTVKPDTTA
jgi:hypothetical protein